MSEIKSPPPPKNTRNQNNPKLNKDLKDEAGKVWHNLTEIMKAGANGEL